MVNEPSVFESVLIKFSRGCGISSFPTDRSDAVLLLKFFLVLCVCGFICGVCVVHIRSSSPSFGASGGLCFMIVAFPGYLQLFVLKLNIG